MPRTPAHNVAVQDRRTSTGLLYSFLMGFISVIVSYRIGAHFGLFETLWGRGIGAAFFFLAAASLPLIFLASNWVCIIVMLGAIPFGVAADATYDSFLNHFDRNLFPFEIAFWWFVTPVPAFIGYSIGCLLQNHRDKL
jgi:hypothetical protein